MKSTTKLHNEFAKAFHNIGGYQSLLRRNGVLCVEIEPTHEKDADRIYKFAKHRLLPCVPSNFNKNKMRLILKQMTDAGKYDEMQGSMLAQTAANVAAIKAKSKKLFVN